MFCLSGWRVGPVRCWLWCLLGLAFVLVCFMWFTFVWVVGLLWACFVSGWGVVVCFGKLVIVAVGLVFGIF